MNLDEIISSLLSLSESDRQKVLAGLALSREATTEAINADKPDTRSELSDLTFPTLPQLLANELKRQNITLSLIHI